MNSSLYIVIGGELENISEEHYKDPSQIKFVGFFDSHQAASKEWKAHSQKDVDNAHMRYRIIKIY